MALLLSLLQLLSVGTAAPLSVEVVKMKSKVKWMAEQLLVRLNRDFQVIFVSKFMLFSIAKRMDITDNITVVIEFVLRNYLKIKFIEYIKRKV